MLGPTSSQGEGSRCKNGGVIRISSHHTIYTKTDVSYITPAMPASPIASNYPLNEQWAPLAVYDKRAPLQRKLWGQHKLTRKAKRYENKQSEMANGARAASA